MIMFLARFFKWWFWFTVTLVITIILLWEFQVKYLIPAVFHKQIQESASPAESPFPAITICNMNKVKGSLYSSLSRKDELKRFFIQDACNHRSESDLVCDEIKTKASQWKHYYYFQQQASQNCSDMIAFCTWNSWGSEHVDCKSWFKPVLTNEGLCCGFNIAHKVIDSGKGRATLDSKVDQYINWNPELKFQESDPPSAIPRRIISSFTDGMSLGLNANISEYFCSKNENIGFEVMIHNPVEIPPLTRENSLSINLGTNTIADLYSYVIEADQEISKLDSDLRKCYFLNERKLRFYRIYTLDNCILDCQASYTMEFCGCLPKHIPVDFSVKICGKTEETCVSNMPEQYKDSCKCYRGCSRILYDYKYFSKDLPNDHSHKENLALLSLNYGQRPSNKYFVVMTDEYFQTMRSIIAMQKWLMTMSLLVLINIIHYYRSDFFASIIPYIRIWG